MALEELGAGHAERALGPSAHRRGELLEERDVHLPCSVVAVYRRRRRQRTPARNSSCKRQETRVEGRRFFAARSIGHRHFGAGAVLGHKVARGRIATVAVNTMQFHQPVSVGDIVSFFAEVEKRGRSSVTIKVQMYAERHPANPITVKVTEALITYVALNADGSKRELPPEAV